MKKKSPIELEEMQFCTFSDNEPIDINPSLFEYDKRHDFIKDEDFAGIAVKLDFYNSCHNNKSGVRRQLTLTLIDATTRCEVAQTQTSVKISKEEENAVVYSAFAASAIDFKAGHTYKLTVHDATASELLNEASIHIFEQEKWGHPSKWYTVDEGGIRPDWEDNLYRTVKAPEFSSYNVRFNVMHNFGYNRPSIMPELEIRLYYPEDERIATRIVEPQCIDFNSNMYFVELSFGANILYSGAFYAELLCMEYPIAGFVFGIHGPNMRGQWYGDDIKALNEYSPEAATARFKHLIPTDECEESYDDYLDKTIDDFISNETERLETDEQYSTNTEGESEEKPETEKPEDKSLQTSLEHLTGLQSVKEKLNVYERMVRFNKIRSDNGLPTFTTPLHAMFLGSPGTGKTTVAKMLGAMLHRAGILSKGHVVVKERSTLLGQFYNSEAEKTIEAIEEAQGGILLIDEAYQLFQPNDPRDPGKFVIEALLTTLADESKRDWMLILAGYPKEMEQMMDMNPGFKSRIPESNIYTFADFTETELLEIGERYLTRQQYTLTPEAKRAFEERLKSDYDMRQKNFGNARHVINMIETEIIPAMAVRITDGGATDISALTQITASDIPAPAMSKIPEMRRVGFKIQPAALPA